MRSRLAVAVLLGVIFAASFAAAAWATQVIYVGGNVQMNPGTKYRSGFTGLGWYSNNMTWTDPWGGTPNMCSNYVNTSGVQLKTDVCSGAGYVYDTRHETSYAAAECKASGSNNYPVLTYNGCWADHN